MNNEKLILESLRILLVLNKVIPGDCADILGRIKEALTPKVNDLEKQREKALKENHFGRGGR